MTKLEKIAKIIEIIQDDNTKNIYDSLVLIEAQGLTDFLNENIILIRYLLTE